MPLELSAIQLLLSGSVVTATGNNLYVNGNLVSGGGGGSSTGMPIVMAQYGISSGDGISQFIPFAQSFAAAPNVFGTLYNNSGDHLLACMISGISTSGFYLTFSETVPNNNYYFNYLAAVGSGLLNFALGTVNSQWSALTWAPTVVWNASSSSLEDRKTLTLTGNVTLSISGLYNGWEGILKVVQQYSGFSLTLPSGTKTVNGPSSLNSGVSGNIDLIAFEYDGSLLMAIYGTGVS